MSIRFNFVTCFARVLNCFYQKYNNYCESCLFNDVRIGCAYKQNFTDVCAFKTKNVRSLYFSRIIAHFVVDATLICTIL